MQLAGPAPPARLGWSHRTPEPGALSGSRPHFPKGDSVENSALERALTALQENKRETLPRLPEGVWGRRARGG